MDGETKAFDSSIPSQITNEYTKVSCISHCRILAAREQGGCLNGIREDTLTIDRVGDLDPSTRFFLAEKDVMGKSYMYVIQVVNNGAHNETISVISSFSKKDHDLMSHI
jgi:hypothetical protein